MNFKNEYKKETGLDYYDTINGEYNKEYIRWLENKIEQLTIHSVVKPFYCVDYCKSKGSVNKCDNQCTGCWQVEKRRKQNKQQ
tara:strand:- start:4020 stop:4268 length:249 start_codon:yes stop_codon:yes gene_type:complete